MATVTQLLANKENAQKSTGPLSYEGKAKASQNAFKHGLRGTRLFLTDEDPNDFQQAMDGLIASLNPAGTLELALVERIAVSLWRQQRLIRAETAGIELARRTDVDENRERIEAALGVGFGQPIKATDFEPPTGDDQELINHWQRLLDECLKLAEDLLEANDVTRLSIDAPFVFEELQAGADFAELPIADFLDQYDDGLRGWISETVAVCNAQLEETNRRSAISAVAALVKSHRSAPIEQELLSRYQASLDNELYKAIRALREVQVWRLKAIDSTGQPISDSGAAGS